MIDIEISDAGIAEVEFDGALTSEDFARVRSTIDGYINEHDSVPNILIHMHKLVHWDSPTALQDHFRLVRDHHKLVKKVAIVGDNPLLAVVPEIADHFVKARVRRFPQSKLAGARAWLESETDEPGEFEVLGGFPDDVVAVQLKGIITGKAYADKLVPLIEAKLEKHDRIKCLIVVDEDFISYTADAVWDDMLLGIRHWTRFARIAVVTDVNWLRISMRVFAPLIPGEFELFDLAQLDEARNWIKR